MREWSAPILGLTACAGDARLVCKDATAVCGGILGLVDPAQLAADRAARERKDELRSQPNVVLLEDYRE